MAINVAQGFNPSTKEPIDSRFIAADATARKSILSLNAYNGLTVYQQDTNEYYVLLNDSDPSLDVNWTLIVTGDVNNNNGFVTTSSFNEFTSSINGFTGSINTWTGSNQSQFAGTSSYATIAESANSVPLVQGPGITINGLEITASVRTVNGVSAVDGNISVALASATLTGLSSSLSGSPFFLPDTYSPRPPVSGTIFVVSGETGGNVSKNGETYVFITSSIQAGQWQQIYGFNTAAADARYARIDVSEIQNLTSSYASTASFVTSSNVYGPHGSDSILSASYAVSSSYALTASYAATSSITYVSSSNFSLSELEIFDYSTDVTAVYTNNRLKLIFGLPQSQSITNFTFNNTFLTNRFNKVLDGYTASASWNNNAYTLIAANIFTGSTLLATTAVGTSLNYQVAASGSQQYRLEITASSPLDNSIKVISQSLSGILEKSNPGNPTQTLTPTVQLGAASFQIEQGATGSINLTSITGSNNDWTITSFTGTSSFGSTRVPLFGNIDGTQGTAIFYVTASATGSDDIIIASTASYSSLTLNDPTLLFSAVSSQTYDKIKSVRYGVAPNIISWTQSDLENLSLWTSSLGPTPYMTNSFIAKGTVYPEDYEFTMNTTTGGGGNYLYIVIDNAYTLTKVQNVDNSNSNDLNLFTVSSVGGYRIYRYINPNSTTILYRLKIT